MCVCVCVCLFVRLQRIEMTYIQFHWINLTRRFSWLFLLVIEDTKTLIYAELDKTNKLETELKTEQNSFQHTHWRKYGILLIATI